MINKERAWETKIDETWVGYRTRTAKFQRKSWRKVGPPLLTENREQTLDYFDLGRLRR